MDYQGSDLSIFSYAEKIISGEQTAFMRNKNTMNGIMTLHEIIHEKKGKKIAVVFKLDFENKNDKVNWNFLFDCLRYRCFYDK